MQSIEQTKQIINNENKTVEILPKGIGNLNLKEIQKQTEKQELNEFLINEVFKEYKSKEHLKEIEFIQLLEANQETYLTETIEILENTYNLFEHELKIKISEILTPEISEELINIEYDYLFDIQSYENYNYVYYDLNLNDCILDLYIQEIEESNDYFYIENDYLIINDLLNYLIDTANNEDIYFNSETETDLIESIIYHLNDNYNEFISTESFNYNLTDYYYMLYIPILEDYIKIDYEDLNIINKDLQKITQQIKNYLAYDENSTNNKDEFIQLTIAIIKKELTQNIINLLPPSILIETSKATKYYLTGIKQ